MLKTSHKKIQNTDIKEDDKIIDIYLWIDNACVIFLNFSLLANYNKIDKTFFLQINANSPYSKLARKRGTLYFLSQTQSIKSENSY